MTISNEKSCLSYIFHSKNGNLRTESILKVKKGRKFKPSIYTVQDGQQITQNVFGEHKVITTEQQFLAVILSFFMHLRWPWLSRFFA